MSDALLPVAVISAVAWVHPVKLVASGVLAICMLLGVVP